MPEPISQPHATASFIKALQQMPDPRDNRGKRHRLSFVLAAVAIAIMAGRAKVSAIQRYVQQQIVWLREITGQPDAQPISRAQLPRILAVVDWAELNTLLESHLGMRLEQTTAGEWIALDGKTLRGTADCAERTLLAVGHTSRQTVAQQPMTGPKESEIAAARELLHETGLEKGRVTLDALHLNPTTTAQIAQAGGTYVIQVKDNQAELKAQLQAWAAQAEVVGSVTTTDKGRGRVETRHGTFVPLAGLALAERWAQSGLETLLVMERHTLEAAKSKSTTDISYYVSNQRVAPGGAVVQRSLFDAVRRHWGIEAGNYIRDVTFHEDAVKTKDGNQGQVLACLRTLATGLLRQAKIKNFQAALENFGDSLPTFKAFLEQVQFL